MGRVFLVGDAALGSYNTERRPHARAMIALARWMGRLVMPMNAVTAFFTHGGIRIARLFPVLRRQLEDQSAKPKNSFANGLFVRGVKHTGLQRGGLLPQGWIRAADGRIELSDEMLGNALTLIGFGTDIVLEPEISAAFAAAGGEVSQVCHRGQALRLSTHDAVWEDIEGSFLSKMVPFGWAAAVRPGRIVLHDGPADDASGLVRESLRILGSPDLIVRRSVSGLRQWRYTRAIQARSTVMSVHVISNTAIAQATHAFRARRATSSNTYFPKASAVVARARHRARRTENPSP